MLGLSRNEVILENRVELFRQLLTSVEVEIIVLGIIIGQRKTGLFPALLLSSPTTRRGT